MCGGGWRVVDRDHTASAGAPLPRPSPTNCVGEGDGRKPRRSAIEFFPAPRAVCEGRGPGGGRGAGRGVGDRRCRAMPVASRSNSPLSARNERGGAGGGAHRRAQSASRRAADPSATPTSPSLFWGRWARFTSRRGRCPPRGTAGSTTEVLPLSARNERKRRRAGPSERRREPPTPPSPPRTPPRRVPSIRSASSRRTRCRPSPSGVCRAPAREMTSATSAARRKRVSR